MQVAKTSNESRVYSFDFSQAAELVAGQTLTGTPTVSAYPSGLTIGAASISGSKVQAQISGGTAGVIYLVHSLVSTSVGSVLEDVESLQVT